MLYYVAPSFPLLAVHYPSLIPTVPSHPVPHYVQTATAAVDAPRRSPIFLPVIRFPPATLQRVNNFNESLLQLIEGRESRRHRYSQTSRFPRRRPTPLPSSTRHRSIDLYPARISPVRDGRKKVHAIRALPGTRWTPEEAGFSRGLSCTRLRPVFF